MIKRIAWISMVVTLCSSLWASPPSARDLLKAWETSQQAMQKVVVRGESRGQRTPPGNAPVNYFCQMNEFRANGDKWDLLLTNWNNMGSPDEAVTLPQRSAFRAIWDGACYYYENFVGITRGRETGHLLVDDSSPRPPVQAFSGCPMLLGRFLSDKQSFSELMGQDDRLTLRQNTEVVDGAMCYVLDGTTPSGKYSVWLSPDRGYNVLRAEVQKGPDDLFDGRPVKDAYPQTRPAGLPANSSWKPRPPLVSLSFVLSGVKCRKIGEVWVPVEGTQEEVARDGSGGIDRTLVNYRAQAVDLNPDFAALGAFVPGVPDGTRVGVRGKNGIPYVWRGGKVVVDVDQEIIKQINDTVDAMADSKPTEPNGIIGSTGRRGTPLGLAVPADRLTRTGWNRDRILAVLVVLAIVIAGGAIAHRRRATRERNP